MKAARYWLVQGNTELINVGDMHIAGLHNAANALAALALCRAIGLDYRAAAGGLA